MHIPWLTDFVIFAQQNGAPAAGQAAEEAPQGEGGFSMFVPLIGIFLIFWFLISVRRASSGRNGTSRSRPPGKVTT